MLCYRLVMTSRRQESPNACPHNMENPWKTKSSTKPILLLCYQKMRLNHEYSTETTLWHQLAMASRRQPSPKESTKERSYPSNHRFTPISAVIFILKKTILEWIQSLIIDINRTLNNSVSGFKSPPPSPPPPTRRVFKCMKMSSEKSKWNVEWSSFGFHFRNS